ncbi:hypothetical protein AB0L59_06540 [Streptomyces sp. NPDC052109]|uniref:hypothetical protein n=1 Tax=Streptomyces sp. NPDC052109 TaxID=3155527 RepID=UPI0034403509
MGGEDGEDGGDGILMYLPSDSSGLGYSETAVLSESALGTPTDAAPGTTPAP